MLHLLGGWAQLTSIRQSDAASPLSDLTDMQALWFLQEEAEAYTRLGKTGLALKRYHQLLKV